MRHVLRSALLVSLLVGATLVLAGPADAATPVGCDLEVVIPWGPEDPIQLAPGGMTDDGTLLVFSSARGHRDIPSDGNDEIWSYDDTSDTLELLTEIPNGSGANASAMLADGGDLVFYERYTEATQSQVRVIDLSADTDTALTPVGTNTNLLAAATDAPVAIFAAVDALADPDDDSAEVYRYETGEPLEALTDLEVVSTDELLSTAIPSGSLSADGETALANVFDPSLGFIGQLNGHLLASGGDTTLGITEGGQLVGPEPRLLFHDGARYTQGAVLNPYEAEVYDRNPATAEPDLLVHDAVLLDPGADGEQLLVNAAHGEANQPGAFLRPERHTVATERRVPLAGRIGTEVVPVVGQVDADVSTVGLTNGNRVILAECGSFSDVRPSQAFAEDIEWLFAEGISTGFVDGSYRPTTSVSRQAMSAFLHRLAGGGPPSTTGPTFSDVPVDHPFHDDIAWASGEDITQGYPDGTFRPSAPVTRQAMAAFLHRLTGGGDPTTPGPAFSDVSASHPFHDDIAWASGEGITQGYPDGTFRPADLVTRQAMAAFLHRTEPLL